MPIRRKYGHKRDNHDARDILYRPRVTRFPKTTDLRAGLGDVYDQGQLGSCTANAVAAVDEYAQRKAGMKAIRVPSRLFVYYEERVAEGTPPDEDSGAMIRTGFQVLGKLGCPPEVPTWPYEIERFATKPGPECYCIASHWQALQYQRLDVTPSAFKSCLSEGWPIAFGFTVYEGFESDETASTGLLHMPAHGESIVGGHAVVAVGHDDRKKIGHNVGAVLVRNSWGPDWGLAGHFWMPYAYLQKFGSDPWTLRRVEDGS